MAGHQDHYTFPAGQNIPQTSHHGEPDVTQLQEEFGALTLEPRTRAEFLQYFSQLTLDPDTVNTHLSLSDGDRKATYKSELQSYPRHPLRFTTCRQVMSEQSLTGRHYWEVEWSGSVDVAVAYEDIKRKGNHGECGFGQNDNSWAFRCHEKKYNYRYNRGPNPVLDPRLSRVGVYLDHSAGILSFYCVEQDSETMTLLRRVEDTFTEPLYAGLYLFGKVGDTAELCELCESDSESDSDSDSDLLFRWRHC